MSATVPDTLSPMSVDAHGLSLATSTPSTTSVDGTGTAYDARTIAAGRLVHLHPVDDTHHLALYSRAWVSATYDTANPGVVTEKTVVDTPTARWVDTAGGVTAAELPTPPQTLVSATSFGSMLFVLGLQDGAPALHSYRVSRFGALGGVDCVDTSWLRTVVLEGEAVIWNRAVYQSGRYTYAVGSNAAGHLFLRKQMLTTYEQRPLFLGTRGWSADPSELWPLRDVHNNLLTSTTAVSLARHGTEWFLSTKAASGRVSFWRAAHPRSGFHLLPDAVELGTTDTAASLHLQEPIRPNHEHDAIRTTGVLTGIPYTSSIESADAIRTSWGLLGVPRDRL